MKFENFISGSYKQQYKYKSFQPAPVNTDWVWDDPRINVLLESAIKGLSELNAYTTIVPEIDMFIYMHIVKEANTSSRIEGTRTEFEEAVQKQEEIVPERRNDWQEVQNYIKAMNSAISDLDKLPLSQRLLKNTHKVLMQGVRGKNKTPGEFRKSQNWIGGSTLNDASYIPPYHSDLPDLLGDLELFWHNESIMVPHLIRCAISHYQFETIHPFLDGNGRIGRLLITLYLVNHGLLHYPSLYLSDYLEKKRSEYYDALSRVRESNDIGHWCRFFLEAVAKTSQSGINTFKSILQLKKEMDAKIFTLGRRAENAKKVITYLYKNPIISVSDISKNLDIKFNAANSIIKSFVEMNILDESTGYKRNRTFAFRDYLSIFTG